MDELRLFFITCRYFKQTWVGSSLCGKDQWFAWHRTFMILTWSLTMAGFIIIFVEIGGWSGEQNPHAILGTVTTFLCFIQPFGALFRPSPTHKNRPIFNWLHWLVGNLAHILASKRVFLFVTSMTILTIFVSFCSCHHFLCCSADKGAATRMDGLDFGGFCWLPCVYAHCAIGEKIPVYLRWYQGTIKCRDKLLYLKKPLQRF